MLRTKESKSSREVPTPEYARRLECAKRQWLASSANAEQDLFAYLRLLIQYGKEVLHERVALGWYTLLPEGLDPVAWRDSFRNDLKRLGLPPRVVGQIRPSLYETICWRWADDPGTLVEVPCRAYLIDGDSVALVDGRLPTAEEWLAWVRQGSRCAGYLAPSVKAAVLAREAC